MIDALRRHPAFLRALAAHLNARFDPGVSDRGVAESTARTRLAEEVDAAQTLDEGHILRALASFVAACVRTNCFQRADDGSYKRHASFKLDSARLPCAARSVPVARSTCTPPTSRASTPGAVTWHVAGFGSPAGPRTTVPRCWA